MLLLCVASAEEANRSRPLLSLSVGTLLDTARDPLPAHWDQTLDLPQVSRTPPPRPLYSCPVPC